MVLPALGFKSTGVATSSVASWLMSWSARANGGGVPAGGVVAMLQSLGESGVGARPWSRHQGHRLSPYLLFYSESFSQANSALKYLSL